MPSKVDYSFLRPIAEGEGLGTLGHYRVLDELGRGGMGFVFRAEDIKLKRVVALKVMNKKISAVPGSRKRFVSEARSMAAVHHDNVATIFEVGESDGTPFMAMEMLRGETLESRNKKISTYDYETIIQFATEICRGLAAAHSRGIVHRDIKPANIWIETETERIKILDFGLALASTPVDPVSGRGAVVGTPGYLSPEQARSDPLDDRSDLYSVGVVLYEMATGQLPIQSKTVAEQLISILAHRPRPIGELNPDVPNPLCETIHRLLSKEPRARFQSAGELERELERVKAACEKESDVAQTINRLQEGLNQVASKPKMTAAATVKRKPPPEPVFDALASIPDPLAMGTTNGTLATPGAASFQPRPQKKKPSGPNWMVLGPVIAVGALLALSLPLMTFLFASSGRRTDAIVAAPSNVAPNNAAPANNPRNSSQNQRKPTSAPKKPKSKSPPNSKRSPKKTTPKARPQPRPTPNNEPDPRPSAEPKPTLARDTPAPKKEQAAESPEQPKPESPESPSVAQQYRSIVITTDDGRGGDAMVRVGESNPLGTRNFVGVRSSDGEETVHTYLRFDLSKIQGNLGQTARVHLMLSAITNIDTSGAVIRLMGIPNAPQWPERSIVWKNSFSSLNSKQQQSKLKELASIVINQSQAAEGDPNTVRISDDRLTEFVKSSNESVTLVLAGGWGDRLLRFASREKPVSDPPRLELSIPE